jgi:chromate reductase
MKILSIGASNSRNSINRALACFTAQLFNDADVTGFDISAMEIPIYIVDREAAEGIPSLVSDFGRQIDETDMVVLSLAEINGSFNVGLNNLLDWTS